jgi:hypothetical protein
MLHVTLDQINSYFQPAMEIVDELGAVDQQIKALEATKAKLKAKLLERGKGFHKGTQFIAEVQEYDRAAISAILVKEYGTADFVQQVTQMQHVKAVVIKPLEA